MMTSRMYLTLRDLSNFSSLSEKCRIFVLTSFAWMSMGHVYGDNALRDTLTHENQLVVNAQLMTRGEIRKGGLPEVNGNIEDKANFIFERSRLSIDFEKTWLETNLTAQHSSVWGQKGSGSLNIYEAWVKLKTKSGMFATIGRQELNYDDERILGRNDWAMAALSHDVLKLGYEGHGHKAHAILAYNQRAENMKGGTVYRSDDGAQPYKTMQTVWYHYDVPRMPLGVSLLFMNIGMEESEALDPKTEFQQLFGGYITFSPRQWNVEGSFYYQTGHDEFSIPIRAFMGSLKATYRPSTNYSLFAGYDYLSGDDNPIVPKKGSIGLVQHKTVKGFSTVYGSHHQFYGAMDFFYVSAYYGGYTPGLQNLFVGGNYSPIKNLSLTANYHYLSVTSKIPEAKRSLGHEIELSASYAIMKEARVSMGYSYMHGTSTLERLQRVEGKNHLQWGWLMLSVNPRIFTTKW